MLTIEDVFLTVEPARKGAPEIGVGNVIGSVVFSVTGKLGIILLTGGLVVWSGRALLASARARRADRGRRVLSLHGQLQRWHGVVLLGLYVLYWVVSFGVFDTVPVDD